ncbi:hypothetical protein F6S87_08250 [Bifidobacterium sp. BRDM6]|uniref:Uncharacterized protein n=1 Tax=Bifidobacterium choloepi TaxID=2614131 RepID=A0A6I5NPE2_9BIFI|nr:hypothetical protein [Bifidobacterium choloepi]
MTFRKSTPRFAATPLSDPLPGDYFWAFSNYIGVVFHRLWKMVWKSWGKALDNRESFPHSFPQNRYFLEFPSAVHVENWFSTAGFGGKTDH